MKLSSKGVTLLAMMTCLCGSASAQGVAVLINGQPVQFDQPPVMQDGRVLVPLRGVFERLGATVVYVPENKEIRANHGSTTIDLTLGSQDAMINGQHSTLDVPAMTIGGRTVVPLRFISESLGAEVKWDAPNRTVAIRIDSVPPSEDYAPAAEAPPSGEYGQVDPNDQPQYFADQAPPPLPDYSQPPVPGPGYVWTPGYWGSGPMGYYWVPGAWTMAPYVGSVWTPGYWGFSDGRYGWHAGYWGPSVGFYGGVNYGYGYVGSGFYGGYWRDGGYYYNRAYSNVGNLPAANVYIRNVTVANRSPVSYNGGAGGLNARPSNAERAVLQQPRLAALPVQRNLVNQAQTNHANWATVNKGRPAQAAVTTPLVQPGHQQPMPAPQFVPAAARPAGNRPTGSSRPATAPAQPTAAPVRQNNPTFQARPTTTNVPANHPNQGNPQGTRPNVHPTATTNRPAPLNPATAPVRQSNPALHARPANAPVRSNNNLFHPQPANRPAPTNAPSNPPTRQVTRPVPTPTPAHNQAVAPAPRDRPPTRTATQVAPPAARPTPPAARPAPPKPNPAQTPRPKPKEDNDR